MNRPALLTLALSFSIAIAAVHAAAPQPQLNAYLTQYIPQGVVNNATFYNQSIANSNYVIMLLGPDTYLVINTTASQDVILTNNTAITPVLGAFVTNSYYPNQTTLTGLNASLHSFIKSSNQTINECLSITGLRGYAYNTSCTLANECFSCQTVPICKKTLNAFGGPTGPFGIGIINFSDQVGLLNSNYSEYFSALSSLSSGNAQTDINQLSTTAANIKSLALNMPNNPIFPVAANFTGSYLTCLNTPPGGVTGSNVPASSGAPWYCFDVGYCYDGVKFNYTQIDGVVSTIHALQTKLSSENIATLAATSTQAAGSYVTPVITAGSRSF